MLFSINEFVDIVIMSLALGFIFKDSFIPRKMAVKENYDPLEHYRNIRKSRVLDGFVFAMIVAAPAVLLHEMGHKLVALSFGMSAEFNAAYFWLGIGVLMKLLNFGFIFFVPAYVSIAGISTPLDSAAIAFAGPGVNLLLFLIPFLLMKNAAFNKRYRQHLPLIFAMSRINLFLFIFNMLPIPGFDGAQIFGGLIKTFV